jgi:hypothetical protein
MSPPFPQLNNRLSHYVLNRSPVNRVQLVIDVAESPRTPRQLRPGTVCNYVHAVMVCDEADIVPLSDPDGVAVAAR